MWLKARVDSWHGETVGHFSWHVCCWSMCETSSPVCVGNWGSQTKLLHTKGQNDKSDIKNCTIYLMKSNIELNILKLCIGKSAIQI